MLQVSKFMKQLNHCGQKTTKKSYFLNVKKKLRQNLNEPKMQTLKGFYGERGLACHGNPRQAEDRIKGNEET